MEKAHDIAQCVGKQIQIELYGVWDYKMAQSWYDIGIRHVIFIMQEMESICGMKKM